MASSVAGRPVTSVRQLVGCPTDEQLLAFLPGELAPDEASSVSEHLAACTSCQSRLTTLRHPSKAAPIEATTPPSRLDLAPALPPGGSDAPTTLLPQPRLRMPERIGQYKLLKQIGRGGMGLVFLAQHVRLGRTVALKLLPGLHLSDKSAIVRLQREIAAAGRLQHPNIVFATDANEEDGIDYLVMEHIEGIDLSRLVAAAGPLPCPDACEIIRQAALGLAHIHSCRLVHRDLKPSNLMLAAGGVVKILDLGLALLREGRLDNEQSATQTGYLLGTADYVSPEQLHDPHDADVRSDLYSLGCTFYKLLTGRAPFGGSEHSTLAKKLDAHRYTAAEPIRTLRPDVPEEVASILARLLAKEPSDRIQEPGELAELLAPPAAGANLPALYQRFGKQAEFDESPGLAPIPPDASTQSQGQTPTPTQLQAQPAARSNWAWLITGVLASSTVVLLAAWTISAFINRGGTTSASAVAGEQPIHGKGPQNFDLSRPLLEKAWIGYVPSPKPVFNEDQRMLEARSESFQLIEIGKYDGRPGIFEVTVRQMPWHGDAGLFFGFRNVPRRMPPRDFEPHSTFQLIWLHYYPLVSAKGHTYDRRIDVTRQRAIIGQHPVHFIEEAARAQLFPLPKRPEVRLKVQFGSQGCVGIWVDDMPLADLTTAAVNEQYGPEDYQGSWGLYSASGLGPKESTSFGNLRFTPLKE